MRYWALLVGVLLSVANTSPVPASIDLRGTARSGDRSGPDAVVSLDAPGAPRPAQTPQLVLDQRHLDSWPHVLAVRVGTLVAFPNSDRVFYNVFSFHDGKRFDLGLYPVWSVRHLTFDRPGLSRIFCNIHPNMTAYVMAVETPYFSVSDEKGRFTIASVLPGGYTYHAWRPGRPELTGRPFDRTTTKGGYAGVIVHRPSMSPVTVVARAERLAYDAAARFALYAQRYAVGARIRLFERLSAEVGFVHQTYQLPQPRSTPIDVGLTYSLRRG